MSRVYLKKAQLTPKSNASEVHETVKNILTDIEVGGNDKAKEYEIGRASCRERV